MKLLISFVAGVVLTLAPIAWLPIPPEMRYDALSGDGVRVKSVHERIVRNSKPIDVAFIGTSHTVGGVSDIEVERLLAASGQRLSVANLAVTWMGRDLHLFLVKQLLEHKKPRLIVIETTEHEYAFGHDLLPYVGELSDVFCCRFFIDTAFPKNFSVYLKWQVLHGLELATGARSPTKSRSFGDYGWLPFDRTWRPAPAAARPSALKQRLSDAGHAASAAYGLDAVRQIVALARSHGVAVAFLYLPSYEFTTRAPTVDAANYLALAPVWKMPPVLASDTTYWFDDSHLNVRGSALLAPALAANVRELLERDTR